jgi:hypothetical protein
MKKLWILLLLAWPSVSLAASYNVTAVRIDGTTTTTTTACHTASDCNGWVAEVDILTLAVGGSYALGLGTNNSTTNAKIVFTVTSSGYQSRANCGNTTTYTRKVYATHVLREPYNNASTNDEATNAGTFTTRLALSDHIFSSDTVTVAIAAGFYTDGSSNTNNSYSASATNNSTLAYSAVRAIFNWTYPGWQRITGSTFKVRGTGFSQYPMNSLPIACVVFTATDAHSHSATSTVSFPTIDPTLGDQAPVIEYIGSLSTSGMTQGDKVTINFKAYPWIGDSTATMDSSDAVYSQPTPLYAPIYGALDTGNTFSAAAYVDGSMTFPGSHTSGTFVAGELCTQSTSSAKAYLIDVKGANGSGPIHLGAVVSGTLNTTSGKTWTGGTSGAVFTQSGAPTYAGIDTNSCAVAESSFNPASPPSACRTIIGGAIKIAAYNNATSSPTHNDACGTVYLAQGYYNWMGSSSTGGNTRANCWLNITPISGTTQAQVVIQGVGIGSSTTVGTQGFGSACTSGLSNCGTPLHVKGVTVNVATSPTSVFNTETFLWIDGSSVTMNGTAPFYQVTDVYITDSVLPSTMAGNGLRPFSTTNISFALLRGNDFSTIGGAGVYAYTVVGNTNKSSQNIYFTNEFASQGISASLMPIFAFNTIYKASTASDYLLDFAYSTSSMIGEAIVQNIFENIYTNESLVNLGLTADSGTATPVNNVMIWDNVLVGGRMNRSYNETGSTALFRQAWSLVGNIMDQRAIKSDTFTTANGARVGNWSELYASGDRSNLFVEPSGGTTGWAASGSFCNEFAGINTYDTTLTGGQPPACNTNTTINYPRYKNRSAYDGTNGNSGGGDYDLLSNSPAINFFPTGTQILPYHLAGQIRNNSGWGSAGAYEQAKILTPVFGW